MATPSRTAFRARLAGLSTDERAGFVVDLARARGWSAWIEGDTPAGRVVCLARGDRRRRLLVHDPGWLPSRLRVPNGVEAVVTWQIGRPRGIPADVEVIDGDALYERTVYGIAAADRERLVREHLGEPPLDDATVPGGRRRRLHLTVALVALAVVATAVAGVPGAPGGERTQQTGPDRSDAVRTPTPFVGSTVDRTTTVATETKAPPPADAYPPGVNESGIVDAAALLAAHVDALRQRSYRLVMTYSEYEPSSAWPGEPAAVRRVRLARRGLLVTRRLVATVEPLSRARTSVSASGRGYGIADPVPRHETYADDGRLYQRIPRENGTFYRLTYRPARVVFGGVYLETALRVDSSRLIGTTVRNGTRLFELRVTGDDDPRTENVTGWLVVDSEGVVRAFVRRYTGNATAVDAPANVSAMVSLYYEFTGVVVEHPQWLAQAQAAMGEDTSAFVPDTGDDNRTATSPAIPRPALPRGDRTASGRPAARAPRPAVRRPAPRHGGRRPEPVFAFGSVAAALLEGRSPSDLATGSTERRVRAR